MAKTKQKRTQHRHRVTYSGPSRVYINYSSHQLHTNTYPNLHPYAQPNELEPIPIQYARTSISILRLILTCLCTPDNFTHHSHAHTPLIYLHIPLWLLFSVSSPFSHHHSLVKRKWSVIYVDVYICVWRQGSQITYKEVNVRDVWRRKGTLMLDRPTWDLAACTLDTLSSQTRYLKSYRLDMHYTRSTCVAPYTSCCLQKP